MIILNLVVRENKEISEVVSYISQSALTAKIREMAENTENEDFKEGARTLTNNDIGQLVCGNPRLFKGTVYEGTRLYISELQD